MNVTNQDKAIVAGLVAAVGAVVARFGWQPNGEAVNLLNVVLTALVPYAVAHVAVYLKLNKPIAPVSTVLPGVPESTPPSL